MTVRDVAEYWADRQFLPDEAQEVKLVFDGKPVAVRRTEVPGNGPVVVTLGPAPLKKFRFSLMFEASPVIEAATLEEAQAKAWEMMADVRVVRGVRQPVMERGATTGVFYAQEDADDYVRMEPHCLEEIKE